MRLPPVVSSLAVAMVVASGLLPACGQVMEMSSDAGVDVEAGAEARIGPLPTPQARFEETLCRFPIPAGITSDLFTSGDLLVPESRASANINMLRLHVARFPAKKGTKSTKSPVVILAGGPGGSVAQYLALGPTLAATFGRDIVLLEQRGTRYALPALECDGKVLGLPETHKDAWIACVDGLTKRSVDAASYNTMENAADVADAARLLSPSGKFVLWGGSYGALLAEAVARDFPAQVESVVLESSVLIDRPYRDLDRYALLDGIESSFYAWFDERCRANDECAKRFPNLSTRAEYEGALAVLRKQSVRVGPTLTIDQQRFKDIWFSLLYSDSLRALAVAFAWGVRHNDIAGFVTHLGGGQPDRGWGYFQYLVGRIEESAALGMLLSVSCEDYVRFWRDEEIDARLALIPPSRRAQAENETRVMREVCSHMPPSHYREEQVLSARRSDVPVLILGGGLDPATPTSWARDAVTTFPRAQLVEFPCMTHNVVLSTGLTCGLRLLTRFLAEPNAALDTSCVETTCASMPVDYVAPETF